MTRTPLQDDFHREVEPALDEDCVWLKKVADKGENVYSPYVILALIDRIRSDREKVAQMMIRNSFETGHGDTIDDLLGELQAHIKFEREQTIRECIEKVKCMSGRLDDRLERKRVVGALEDLSNHSAAGIPSSDPVRELRDNYKCGEEYEAGLWSRRNIEAFFRDQDKKS